MKKITVFHTGGTIAMHEDHDGNVQLDSINPLYATSQTVASDVKLSEIEFVNIPSPHMTIQLVHELSKKIQQIMSAGIIDGIVITHGTDTLEETAYLLDLLLHCKIPVVVTGAMRPSNELSADGPLNYHNAIRIAKDDKSKGRGVLVCLNGTIHEAKNVTKSDTSNVDTFESMNSGPCGIVLKEAIMYYHPPNEQASFDKIEEFSKNVVLLKTYIGMDPSIIHAIASTKIDGLVIEAFGQGNVPPTITPVLKQLIGENIPIVIVSRCPHGIVQPAYSYEGGGHTLEQMNAIFAKGLNGQKARLKLLVALEYKMSIQQMKEFFK